MVAAKILTSSRLAHFTVFQAQMIHRNVVMHWSAILPQKTFNLDPNSPLTASVMYWVSAIALCPLQLHAFSDINSRTQTLIYTEFCTFSTPVKYFAVYLEISLFLLNHHYVGYLENFVISVVLLNFQV